MNGTRRKPRADEDDDVYPTLLGIGNLHGVAGPDEEPADEPAIWLPQHRSGSRFGGWQRRSMAPPRRPMGFRRP